MERQSAASIQILTASSAMVKTTTPEVIVVLTQARVKAVNICFVTPQQTIYHLHTCNNRMRVSDTQMHN